MSKATANKPATDAAPDLTSELDKILAGILEEAKSKLTLIDRQAEQGAKHAEELKKLVEEVSVVRDALKSELAKLQDLQPQPLEAHLEASAAPGVGELAGLIAAAFRRVLTITGHSPEDLKTELTALDTAAALADQPVDPAPESPSGAEKTEATEPQA